MDINKIIVPVDIKHPSSQHIRFAFDLASKNNAQIDFIYIYKIGTDSLNKEEDKIYKDHLYQLIKVVEEWAFEHDKVDFACTVEMGFPVDKIIDNLNDSDYDLMLLGAHNKKRLFEPNGVSFNVLKKSNTPCIIVPDTYRITGLDHIIFCIEFEFEEIDVIQDMLVLSDVMDCRLTCVHTLGKYSLEEAEKKIDTYKRLFEGFINQDMIDFEIVESDDDRAVEKYAVENNGDLIVMLRKRPTWSSNYLGLNDENRIIKGTNIPVMVLP